MCVVEDCGQGCVDEEVATLTAEREREKRSEWREGIVAVIDHDGDYLGCMGSKTWADVADWMAGHGPIADRLKRANERIEEVELERDALRTALEKKKCNWHREHTTGYAQLNTCDDMPCRTVRSVIAVAEGRILREALGGKS